MSRILIIADKGEGIKELPKDLAQMGFSCSIVSDKEAALKQIVEKAPDIVLAALNSQPAKIRELCQKLNLKRPPAVIALASTETLNGLDASLVDDFVVTPYDVKEITLRVKRLLGKTSHKNSDELIKCGDLVIDPARCEVLMADRSVVLTYREYELLRFLASSRGRVFSRQVLLDKVWGYDYYGGDRTVDVHIRRLRSKIEDSGHTFIETIRNIGYRFCRD